MTFPSAIQYIDYVIHLIFVNRDNTDVRPQIKKLPVYHNLKEILFLFQNLFFQALPAYKIAYVPTSAAQWVEMT